MGYKLSDLEKTLKEFSLLTDKISTYKFITAEEFIKGNGSQQVYGKKKNMKAKDVFQENKVYNHQKIGTKDNFGAIKIMSKYNFMLGYGNQKIQYEKDIEKLEKLDEKINSMYLEIKSNPFKTAQYKLLNKVRWLNVQLILDEIDPITKLENNDRFDLIKIKKLYGNTGNTGI